MGQDQTGVIIELGSVVWHYLSGRYVAWIRVVKQCLVYMYKKLETCLLGYIRLSNRQGILTDM